MKFKDEISIIEWEYVGKGRWMFGIPKRNLSQKDLIKFNIDPSVLERSPLYKKVEPKVEIQKEVKIYNKLSKEGKED